MHVQLSFDIDDSGDQTPLIADLLAALAARNTPPAEEPKEAKKLKLAPVKRVPEVKEPEPEYVVKPKMYVPEPEPDEEPEQQPETDSGVPMALEPDEPQDQDRPTPTLDDAVARATELIHLKKQPKIREVLRAIGEKRGGSGTLSKVSDLKPTEVPLFLDALAGVK